MMLLTANSSKQGDLVPLAIICNSLTPYRLHFHRRIVAELPRVRLWTVFTHEAGDSPRAHDPPPDINPISFGNGELASQQGRLNSVVHEWQKGGRIIDWMNEQGIRAVVVNGYNDVGRLRIIRWGSRAGIPCFLFADSNIRGDRARGARGFAKNLLLRWVVNSCTGILPCGTMGEAYFKKYRASADRIFFSPYEPDYDQVRQLSQQEIEEVCRRFRLPSGRRTVVFSGRLIEQKRPDLVVEAFAAIAAARPEWDLLMIGDGHMKQLLTNMVPEAIKARVFWAGFLSDQRTISALYRAADVLVLPSEYEPWGVVISEAAAAGLAIIATDAVGAAAELVHNGVNGRLIPVRDVVSLGDALLEVTSPTNIDRLKSGSAGVLAAWVHRGDPIDGLRRALWSAGMEV
jgi:glycosyltransferase involved in cell wall biosynthesis